MMIRWITLSIILLVSLSVGSLRASAEDALPCEAADGDQIRIGAIFPEDTLFTVSLSQHYEGTRAMVEAINTCGGVNGRPVELIYRAASDRMDAREAGRDLIENEGVQLIVGSGIPAVQEGLAETALDHEVVLWEVSQAVMEPNAWTFSPRPTNYQLGKGTAEFVESALLDVLDGSPRVALIYEEGQRGEQTADGLRDTLGTMAQIEIVYDDVLSGVYALGDRLRDEDINVVILSSFDDDADHLWRGAQQADANVSAWIHVGSAGYQQRLCQRVGNTEAIISVTAQGPVSEAYRDALDEPIFSAFRRAYVRSTSEPPTERAILSASGMYMLLRYVLPDVEGEFSADNIRDAIIGTEVAQSSGFMGEGLSFAGSANTSASVIVQQRQGGGFCSVWPGDVATCMAPVQPMPTWRERAIMAERMACGDAM